MAVIPTTIKIKHIFVSEDKLKYIPITHGYMIIVEDTGDVYYDTSFNTRIQITNKEILSAIANINSTLKNLDSRLIEAEDDIDDLQSTSDSNRRRITAAEAAIEELKTENSDLKEAVQANTDNIETLQDSYDSSSCWYYY